MITANPMLDTGSLDTLANSVVVDEAAIEYELDHRIEKTGLFRIYKQVCGVYLQPRLGVPTDKGCRIDRILFPTPKLLDAGWSHGIIGVECKKAGMKLGPALAQCMDYSRAAFQLPLKPTLSPDDEKRKKQVIDVFCRWVMLWPMDAQDIMGDVGSLMDQNRVGGVTFNTWNPLTFKTASRSMLNVDKSGKFTVGDVRCGYKVGSR